jgi:hypothetical protein
MENKGFGDRLRESIRKAGFQKKDGSANISRFARKHELVGESVRGWVNGREPSLRDFAVLLKGLPVNALWLIMGEEPESEASVKTQAEEENRGRMRQVGEPRGRQT